MPKLVTSGGADGEGDLIVKIPLPAPQGLSVLANPKSGSYPGIQMASFSLKG